MKSTWNLEEADSAHEGRPERQTRAEAEPDCKPRPVGPGDRLPDDGD